MVRPAAAPRLLGRYALYHQLASGGMASVFIGRLRGAAGFARTVAIKRMHPHFASEPEFVSMFVDEARLAARIHHPNVVSTLDVLNEDGELFLVMDYVHGESLYQLLRRAQEEGEQLGASARIQPEIVVSIMAGVLHGLHAAHEARSEDGSPLGIVHRDVSPQNIIVGVDGVARVLDFGVAKAASRLQSTREGEVKGKLAYISPEQISEEPIDRRSDVYAASVVLWEALASRRLYVRDTDAAMVVRILAGAVEPPSKHAPGLPDALDAIVMRGLSLKPEDRYPTARAMARALEDSVAPVVPSRVGTLVESLAREALARRAARIEEIESDSAAHQGPFSIQEPAESAASTTGDTRPGASAGDLEAPAGEPSQLTSISVSTSMPPRGLRRRRRLVVTGAAALAALAVAVVLTLRSAARAPSAAVGGVQPAVSPTQPAAIPLPPVTTAPLPAPADSTLSALPSAASPSASAGPARRAVAPAGALPLRHAARHASSAGPPAAPPKKDYAYDHM